MDSLHHVDQKLLAEQARNQFEQDPLTAPPPYTASDGSDSDSDNDDGDDEHDVTDDTTCPVKLVVNASQMVRGSNNVLPTSPSLLSDASRLGQVVAAAVGQLNSLTERSSNQESGRRRKAPRVDLTINCGLTIIGDRNVVGHVALRPRSAPTTGSSIAEGQIPVAIGDKRPAEEALVEEPSSKRATPYED